VTRLAKPCNTPGCPQLQPCPDHRAVPWAGTRRDKTLNGWQQQARARRTLRRHNGICHICGLGGATQVDHVVPLGEDGPDTDANLRPVHLACHQRKTADEAARARRRAIRG
jgi:5-methylcytosine-specific restriction endonuclease McrA